MLDLFDTPILPGIAARPDLLSAAEERALIEAIDEIGLTPFRFQQWTGKRLTRSFGWSYDFQTGTLSRGDPLPDWLLPIRARAAAIAGILPEAFVQALLIRYDPGAGMGWHKDRPIYEHVVGISLGAPAEMRFRRREGSGWRRATMPLQPRCLYHLSGEARHEWEHSIAEVAHTRWSITLRSFSDRGRRLARDASDARPHPCA